MSTERPIALSREDAAYVHSGTVPYPYRRWAPLDVERVLLATMARWAWTRDAAWTTVRASHPNAFQTLRTHPDEFDEHWARAGGTLPGAAAAPEMGPIDEPRLPLSELTVLLGAAIGQMWGRLHQIPRRARPRAVQVALAVIARCATQGSLRVAVPLRSLQLDTGMRSRGAVLEGLREAALLLGCLHASFDPRMPLDSSHELELIVEREGVAGGPLGITHPLPTLWTSTAAAITDWVGLPGDAPLVWAALLSLGGKAKRTELADLVAAGSASRQTRRTVHKVLDAMAERGLVSLTTRRVRLGEAYLPDPPDDLRRLIASERRRWAFRCHAFDLNRQERTRDQLDRQRDWWHSLPDDERAARRAERQAWFANLPCDLQDHYRRLWARQRQRAGVSVRQAHHNWCEEHMTVARRRERRAWYRTQAPDRQLELVACWSRWRVTHEVGRYRANRLEEVEPPSPRKYPKYTGPRWPGIEWTPPHIDTEADHAGETLPTEGTDPPGPHGGPGTGGVPDRHADLHDGRPDALIPGLSGG